MVARKSTKRSRRIRRTRKGRRAQRGGQTPTVAGKNVMVYGLLDTTGKITNIAASDPGVTATQGAVQTLNITIAASLGTLKNIQSAGFSSTTKAFVPGSKMSALGATKLTAMDTVANKKLHLSDWVMPVAINSSVKLPSAVTAMQITGVAQGSFTALDPAGTTTPGVSAKYNIMFTLTF